MNFELLSQSCEKEYLEKVSKILQVPSVYEKCEVYPYGKSIDDALNLMLSIGHEDGFHTKNVDGHAGHIEFGEGEELLGILGHLDVVPAGEGWSTSPFSPTIKDGKLYARGSQDDKGPVVAAYMAMKLLKEQGFKPKKRVRLILGTDEERDWKGMEYYLNHEEMPDFGFSPDASFPVIHAEKGLIDSYLSFPLVSKNHEETAVELLEFTSGDRLNMVPDKAVATVRSKQNLNDHFNKYLEEHGLSGTADEADREWTFRIEGQSVHASTPEAGVNAITALLSYLETLPLTNDVLDALRDVRQAFSSTDGSGVGIQTSDDVSGNLTLNLGFISFKSNRSCEVGLNLRYPVTSDYDQVFDALRQFAESREGSLEIYDHMNALYLEEDHPFIQTLLGVYNNAMNEEETVKAIGGATYARSLETGVAFGAMFADSPDTAHQQDEHVRLEDMIKSIAIYAASIYELTK